jgi:hypothetical protein
MQEVSKTIWVNKKISIKPITHENMRDDFIKMCKKCPIGRTGELIKVIEAFNSKYSGKFQMAIFPTYRSHGVKPMLASIEKELGSKTSLMHDPQFLNVYNSMIHEGVYMRLPARIADGDSDNYFALQLRLSPLPVPHEHKDNHMARVSSLALVALILAAKENGKDRIHYYLFADNERSHKNWNKLKRDLKLSFG